MLILDIRFILTNWYFARRYYVNALASFHAPEPWRVLQVLLAVAATYLAVCLIRRYAMRRRPFLVTVPALERSFIPSLVALALVATSIGAARVARVELARDRVAQDGPNILLISMDTLRADVLGTYGCEDCRTPNIDRLAAEGVLFEQMISTSNWTLPAHATMLTGLSPITHGARSEKDILPRRFTTLAEMAREAGYETAASTVEGWVSPDFGFDQGFDHFESEKKEPEELRVRIAQVVEWLHEHKDRKWMLFVHSYQTHIPYFYHEGFTDPSAKPGMIDAPSSAQTLPRRLWETAYRGEVAYADSELGVLFEALRQMGLDRNTLIVLTSDHGEAFGEHHAYEHGATLFEEEIHVPLIFRFPGVLPAGRRVRIPVSLVDLMPTISSIVGFPPVSSDGFNLVPVIRDEADSTRPEFVFAEARLLSAVRTASAKLIVHNETRARSYYDLAADPGELRAVSASDVSEFEWLDPVLSIYLHQYTGPTRHISPETAQHLRDLGYIK